MAMENYKDLLEWQKAVELTVEVAALTKKLAKAENLRGEVSRQHVYNRDAEAIALDIATASGRAAMPHEQLRFISAAQGTTFRLETRLLLDVRREYVQQVDAEPALKLCAELGEILNSKIATLSEACPNRNRQSIANSLDS